MEQTRLHVVAPDQPTRTSPLAAARARRGMTVEEVAARSGLEPEDVRCLEESRIYRFPSVNDALAAALVYAGALGISEREARRLAGLPGGREKRWSFRRWLAIAGFAAALAGFAWFGVVPELRNGEDDKAASELARKRLPPPWEIRVDVFNGTSVPNAATRVANEVGGPLAYRLGTVENADRLDYLETKVYYPPGSREIAERLAASLGVETAALPGGGDRKRLVVIVGRDLARAR